MVARRIRIGSAAAGVVWTFTDTGAEQAGPSDTFTFPGVALGSAGTRLTIVAVNTTGAIAAGVTVGGLSATKEIQEAAAISGLQIWYVDSTSLGTTATIAVTGTAMTSGAIVVGKLTGVTATPTDSQSANNGTTDPSTITETVPASGIGIVALASSGVAAGSWTDATEDANIISGTGSLVVAHTTTTGSVTPSYTLGGATASHVVMACWGP
jgi:hypothetical protein